MFPSFKRVNTHSHQKLNVMAKKLEWFRNAITGGNEEEKMSDDNDDVDTEESLNLKNKPIYTIAEHHTLIDL